MPHAPDTSPAATRVALVTGGTRGIGLGIARALAAEGWALALNGRRPESEVTDVVRNLRREGARDVLYVAADVADADDRKRLVRTTVDGLGPIHALVNNAGVAPEQRLDILEATEASWDRVLTINLKGPYFLTQLVANSMLDARRKDPAFRACMVNVTSISSTVASPSRGEYCVSKAGLSMMSRLFAVRLAEADIPVYEVRPGVTRTDMTAGVQGKYDALIEQGLTLQKRWGFPEDVGKAVAMLARGDLPYSTGQVIMVDGGLTVGRL